MHDKKEELSQLANRLRDEFDGTEPADPEQGQSYAIAMAFYLMTSQRDINEMIDDLVMLLSNQDPEMEWCKHTVKTLARFLNNLNHPSIRTQ